MSLLSDILDRIRQPNTAKNIGNNPPPSQNIVGQIAKAAYQGVIQPTFQQTIKPYIQNVGQSALDTIANASKLTPQYRNIRAVQQNPVSISELLNAGKNTALGGLTTLYNASPLTPARNALLGTYKSIREGRNISDILQNTQASILNPPSIGEAATSNPSLASKIDIASIPLALASGKAKVHLSNLKNKRTLESLIKNGEAMGMVGVNPKAFSLHADDYQVMSDYIRFTSEGKKVPEIINRGAQAILENLLPGYKHAKTVDVKKAFEYILDVNDQVKTKRIRMPEPYKMGFSQKIEDVEPSIVSTTQTTRKVKPISEVFQRSTQQTLMSGARTPPIFSQEASPALPHTSEIPIQSIKGLKSSSQRLKQAQSLDEIIPRKTTEVTPLNVKRLDLNSQQKERVLDSQIKEVRDILSEDEIRSIAKDAGFDTKTYTIDQTAGKIAEQLNVRRRVVELENQRTNLLQKGASEDELLKVTREIADTSRISREQGTDIARQLSHRRIIANEINTPMQRIFQLLDKAGVNPDVYVKDATKVDFNNGKEVVDFYRKYAPATAKEWIDLVRYNSMLSSPNTLINNFFSNLQGSALIAPIEKTITGGLDALKSALTGKPRKYAVGEGGAYLGGYIQNVGKAVQNFGDVMKGKTFSSIPDFREIPLTQSASRFRREENLLRLPMKLLEATDQFFTTLTQGGAEKALAYRKSRGINVLRPDIQAETEATRRLFRSKLGENEGSMALDAIDYVANMVQRAKSVKNPVVSTIARYSLPFVRTPTNILKQGMEYSPAGILTLPGAKNKTEQLSKAIMGTSIATGAALLLGSDRLTWAEPTSEKQKNAFRDAGMQPYSVKIGEKEIIDEKTGEKKTIGNWVSYSKLHPAIAFNLALIAAVKNAEDNKDLNESQVETILKGASKWLNFFADQSYVKSIGDLVASTKGDIESPTRIVGNYAQQLVPFRALSGWVARILDPYQRKVDPDKNFIEKQFDYLKTQIPFVSMTLPTRTNEFGAPIKNQNRYLNAVSPVRVTTEDPDKRKIFDLIKKRAQQTKRTTQLREMLKRGEAPSGFEVQAAEESGVNPDDQLNIQQQKLEDSLAKSELEYSGKRILKKNGKVYYLNDKDNAQIVDPSSTPQLPEFTGLPEIDKKLISQFEGAITSKENDLLELVKIGELSPQEAAIQIKELNDQVKDVKERHGKSRGGGGTGKRLQSQIISFEKSRQKAIFDIKKESRAPLTLPKKSTFLSLSEIFQKSKPKKKSRALSSILKSRKKQIATYTA